MPLLGQVRHLSARHHDLEHTAIDLPVAELSGPPLLHAQVDDVQPVTKVVKNQARLAVVRPDRPRFPQRVELTQPDLLAPDPAGGGGEAILSGGGGAAKRVTSRSEGPTAAW